MARRPSSASTLAGWCGSHQAAWVLGFGGAGGGKGGNSPWQKALEGVTGACRAAVVRTNTACPSPPQAHALGTRAYEREEKEKETGARLIGGAGVLARERERESGA